MFLFEILTASLGESYVRSYAWCESEEEARSMFEHRNAGHTITAIRNLFSSTDPPFITKPNDHGFGDDDK